MAEVPEEVTEEVAELVQRTQLGDRSAFDGLVRRFQDMAVGYSYSLLGDFHLAEAAVGREGVFSTP